MNTHTQDTVVVTGATGRIGSAVMRRLSTKYKVVGFDLRAPAQPLPDCEFIAADIASDEGVREALRTLREHHGTHVASVIHLAAYYDFLGKPSPKYDQITVEGTRRLLRGLRDGFDVEQFVFSSTMLVHRPGEPGEFINEDWPLQPTWAYPESKVRTERLIHDERGAIRSVVLRLAGVYDDVCHSPPLAHQIQRICEHQMAGHLYSGEVSHGQSFIHLDDVVDAIERTVDGRAGLPAETAILIGEPETLSYDELQHTFMRLIHGKSSETHNVPGLIAKAGAWVQDHLPGQHPFIKPWMIDRANDHYALDITRAQELLGWQPQHTLRKSLPKMVAALQTDPLQWYREHGLEPPEALAKLAAKIAPAPVGAVTTEEAACHMHSCPMHEDVCQSSPGNCPRCGEALQAAAVAADAEYTCPMHPEVVSKVPGRCPKCGMALELRHAREHRHA
ncbi:MAG: heavy metal-binding domain-containing protein [Nevskiales bacterium]|nr:heavy metal-binding domain-containing protein [Nevskiales bacterium]